MRHESAGGDAKTFGGIDFRCLCGRYGTDGVPQRLLHRACQDQSHRHQYRVGRLLGQWPDPQEPDRLHQPGIRTSDQPADLGLECGWEHDDFHSARYLGWSSTQLLGGRHLHGGLDPVGRSRAWVHRNDCVEYRPELSGLGGDELGSPCGDGVFALLGCVQRRRHNYYEQVDVPHA